MKDQDWFSDGSAREREKREKSRGNERENMEQKSLLS
jgi:hypothetical protein